MNPKAQQMFDTIVAKSVLDLTPAEADFLKARRDYLTSDQKEKFAEVLEGKVAEVKDEGKTQEPEIKLKDLKVRGEAVGLTYKVGTKKEDFLKQVEEAEKANQPE